MIDRKLDNLWNQSFNSPRTGCRSVVKKEKEIMLNINTSTTEFSWKPSIRTMDQKTFLLKNNISSVNNPNWATCLISCKLNDSYGRAFYVTSFEIRNDNGLFQKMHRFRIQILTEQLWLNVALWVCWYILPWAVSAENSGNKNKWCQLWHLLPMKL